jgi:hypothetical protein
MRLILATAWNYGLLQAEQKSSSRYRMKECSMMRLVLGLLGVMAYCAPSFAQNFPASLITNDKALACTAPEKIRIANLAIQKKDPRALRRTGCRQLRGGMQVSVEFAERVAKEDYHLIRISWRRGRALWAYSYDFKRP